MEQKIILQLCADTGSDTRFYKEAGYKVILVGRDIGVENFHPPRDTYGIIANPVCTEFSIAKGYDKEGDYEKGMFLVRECQRVISECNPTFWVIENPAKGRLKNFLGEPIYRYQPWWYGSPWTKETALWGKFNIPPRKYFKWEDVPKLEGLYTRPKRGKPALVYMHARKHAKLIPEFAPFLDDLLSKPARDKKNGGGADMEFRSLCSQKFAQAFFEANP